MQTVPQELHFKTTLYFLPRVPAQKLYLDFIAHDTSKWNLKQK